ncbi:Transcription initiation factor TFIID subunit 13 [Penicillium odoratum]|uniref:Transcription initiation factor TFIID subunit 13 n=1 Tax=Penicillium odoratum TaxID=1167516 RepID=UPI0025469451|nr:Transcription initiation factor TFIID subunit 13 [Penicillium odoratum]KAJ5768853.1 Transcription initiation factor TFIID subunit 13 [Penicillium odoratum]
MSAERTDHRGHLKLRLKMPPPPIPSQVDTTPISSSTPTVRRPLLLKFPTSLKSVPGHPPGAFEQSGRYNSQDNNYIDGYEAACKTSNPSSRLTVTTSASKRRLTHLSGMAEPRARAARHKGQMNFSSELRLLLLAYGDPSPHPSFSSEPLPETVRVLDEIVTDFILELCHGAAQVAHHARRQKIKVDDFRFALRRDPNKLGRVQELLRMERELKEARKAFDQNDDQVAKDAGKKGTAPGNNADAETEALPAPTGKKAKGKGKRAATRRGSDATEESVSKKRKTLG